MLLRDAWGAEVRLTEERLAHILEHPEMQGQEDRVAETLRQPEAIVQSQSDETVRLFFRFYEGLVVGDKHLCVVVKYSEADAFIITAYFTDRVKTGELLWER